MNVSEVRDWWTSFYGTATPVSHILRKETPELWMRIHSLPESKRYANTLDEYLTLLSRHNEVATEMLGLNKPCLLFSGQYVGNAEQKNSLSSRDEFRILKFDFFDTIEDYPAQVDPDFGPDILNIWFAPVVWSINEFDDVIKVVADDEVRHILIASIETGEAYAPYDGGADLFCHSSARRDELKTRYQQWLSIHPEGL